MHTIELTIVLLILTGVGGALVRWAKMGLPIFLVVIGAAASLLPGLDRISIDPQLFLLLFIPPLLFADARVLPRRDLLQVLRPVLLLALGLVVLTVVVVGYTIHWLVPSMPLAVAFTLGAIVTPTDAVATVATTAGLPLAQPGVAHHQRRELAQRRHRPGGLQARGGRRRGRRGLFHHRRGGEFPALSGGGVCVGFVVQWLGRQLRQRLVDIGVDDPVLQTLLTVLVPYAAYLAAEALQVSGVLAVVIAGLWTGGKEVRGLSAESRRHAREVWRMISYVFNGLVFVLLGLQLRHMLAAVGHYDAGWLAGLAFGLWALLMALRLSWVWISAHVRFRLQWGWAGARSGPDGRRMFLVAWAAVRGSVTLATALSVPLLTTSGSPFPERELVVFLAAATIMLTLALNGIPLPWLIRTLRAPSDAVGLPEENAARVALARAGIAAVQSLLAQRPNAEGWEFAEQLIHRYEGKITLREGDASEAAVKAEHISIARRLRLAGIQAERECLNRLHAQAVINDETLRIIEEELDEREMLSSADPLRG